MSKLETSCLRIMIRTTLSAMDDKICYQGLSANMDCFWECPDNVHIVFQCQEAVLCMYSQHNLVSLSFLLLSSPSSHLVSCSTLPSSCIFRFAVHVFAIFMFVTFYLYTIEESKTCGNVTSRHVFFPLPKKGQDARTKKGGQIVTAQLYRNEVL